MIVSNSSQTVAIRRSEPPSWQTTWTNLANTKGYQQQLTAALQLMKLNTCAPLCACSCHQRRHKQSPRNLKNVTGTVSIGYSKHVLPSLKSKRCDLDTCRSSGPEPSVATYHLPPWVANKAARFVIGHIQASNRPTRALTVQNVREMNGELFCAARSYYPQKLMRLLREGKGRPSDVDEDGESLLHAAIRFSSSTETIRYLLSIGADPHHADLSNMTPYDRAYEYILKSGGAVGTTGYRYREIFPNTEPLSSWGLTILHKIILGIDLRPLHEALLDPEILKDINSPDMKGRTALWWAIDQKRPFNHSSSLPPKVEDCNHWMLPRIQALLDAGADPNIADTFGDPPLRQSMLDKWLNIPMMRLLASYGADLLWCNKNKMSSLHVAARYHNSQELMDLLASAPGWEKLLNARGGMQMKTPLQIALNMNHTVPARWLMDHGADIEMRDTEFGDTAILYAIDHEHYDAVEHLLETRKPNLQVSDIKIGKVPILNHASARGNARLYNLLASHRAARDMDLTKRSDTKSAWNLFETLAAGGWETEYEPDPPHVPEGGFARDAFWRLLNTKTCERCALHAARGIPAPVGLCPIGWKGSKRGWKGVEPLRWDDDEERTEHVRWKGRMKLEENRSKSSVSEDDLPPHGLHVEDDVSIRDLWINTGRPGRPGRPEELEVTDDKAGEELSDDEDDADTDSDTAPLLNEKGVSSEKP